MAENEFLIHLLMYTTTPATHTQTHTISYANLSDCSERLANRRPDLCRWCFATEITNVNWKITSLRLNKTLFRVCACAMNCARLPHRILLHISLQFSIDCEKCHKLSGERARNGQTQCFARPLVEWHRRDLLGMSEESDTRIEEDKAKCKWKHCHSSALLRFHSVTDECIVCLLWILRRSMPYCCVPELFQPRRPHSIATTLRNIAKSNISLAFVQIPTQFERVREHRVLLQVSRQTRFKPRPFE